MPNAVNLRGHRVGPAGLPREVCPILNPNYVEDGNDRIASERVHAFPPVLITKHISAPPLPSAAIVEENHMVKEAVVSPKAQEHSFNLCVLNLWIVIPGHYLPAFHLQSAASMTSERLGLSLPPRPRCRSMNLTSSGGSNTCTCFSSFIAAP